MNSNVRKPIIKIISGASKTYKIKKGPGQAPLSSILVEIRREFVFSNRLLIYYIHDRIARLLTMPQK